MANTTTATKSSGLRCPKCGSTDLSTFHYVKDRTEFYDLYFDTDLRGVFVEPATRRIGDLFGKNPRLLCVQYRCFHEFPLPEGIEHL